MSKRVKVLALIVGLIALFALVISIYFPKLSDEEQPDSSDTSVSSDPYERFDSIFEQAQEQPPAQLRLSDADTYLESPDLTNTWVSIYSADDNYTFAEDGTYMVNGYARGVYRVFPGYLTMVDYESFVTYLRVVNGAEYGICLTDDNSGMPSIYIIKTETYEPVSTIPDETGVEMDATKYRIYLDTINQILTKSDWHCNTELYQKILFSDTEISFLTSAGTLSAMPYSISSFYAKDGGYFGAIEIGGASYRFDMTPRVKNMDNGYFLRVYTDDSTLFDIDSTGGIELSEF